MDNNSEMWIEKQLQFIHDYGIAFKNTNTEIWLVGERDYTGNLDEDDTEEPGVEHVMASRFIKNMEVAKMRDKPVFIHMKTGGGDWAEGMAIYESICSTFLPTTILCYTHAVSMSSIILQAADDRLMMPSSEFMLHEGQASISGTRKEVDSFSEFSKRETEIMIDIYASRMSVGGKLSTKGEKQIKNWLKKQMDTKADVYFTPEQAVEYGLADAIYGIKEGWV